jgi:hypothetical protein
VADTELTPPDDPQPASSKVATSRTGEKTMNSLRTIRKRLKDSMTTSWKR